MALRETKTQSTWRFVRNVLGEVIDHVEGVWDLTNADLRGRLWAHANPSGICLDGSDLSETNLLGANLGRASLRHCTLLGCEISYADVLGATSNIVRCMMYKSETHTAKFHNVLFSAESDIPLIQVFQTIGVSV